MQTYIQIYLCTQSYKISIKLPPYNSSQIHLCTIIHTSFTRSRRTYVTSFIKPQKGFIKPSIIISSCWKPNISATLRRWGDLPNKTWDNWKPAHSRAPGRQLILPKFPKYNLVDDNTTKRVKIWKSQSVQYSPYGTSIYHRLLDYYPWIQPIKTWPLSSKSKFQKILLLINLRTWNWNMTTTSYRSNYMTWPSTSGYTWTTILTVVDSELKRTRK